MTMALVELPLGEVGRQYLQSSLEGLGGLSEAIRPRVQAGKGRVFSPLPEGISLADAMAFGRDGIAPYDDTHDWFMNQALAFCRAHPDSTVIFETNWKGEYGEPAVMEDTRPKFFYKSLPYYYAGGQKVDDEAIWQAMNGANGLGLAGAFVRHELTSEEIPADGIVSDALIRTLADNAVWAFVAAYDTGGFVIWEQQPVSSVELTKPR